MTFTLGIAAAHAHQRRINASLGIQMRVKHRMYCASAIETWISAINLENSTYSRWSVSSLVPDCTSRTVSPTQRQFSAGSGIE
jgi:hypothetical protein